MLDHFPSAAAFICFLWMMLANVSVETFNALSAAQVTIVTADVPTVEATFLSVIVVGETMLGAVMCYLPHPNR